MTFYTFMMRTHLHEGDTPKGRLAEAMKISKERFPKNGRGKFDGWHRLIRSYLERHFDDDETLAAFEESWKEYVACVKK